MLDSSPFGWLVMNNWQENFDYRIEIGAGVFVLAMAVTFLVAMITVGYQSLKGTLAISLSAHCLNRDLLD